MIWLQYVGAFVPALLVVLSFAAHLARRRTIRARLDVVRASAAAATPPGEPWRLPAPAGGILTELADRSVVELPPRRFGLEGWIAAAFGLMIAALPLALGVRGLRDGERTPEAFGAAALGLLVAYAALALATRHGERIVLLESSRDGIRLATWRPLLPGRVLRLAVTRGWSVSGSIEERRGEPPRYVLTLSPGGLALGDKVLVDDAALGAWLEGTLSAWRQRVPRG